MAVPVADTVAQAIPFTDKINSQELIFTIILLIISSSVFTVVMKYVYHLLVKRDDALSDLTKELAKLTVCLNKVIEIQSSDHEVLVSNRNILQEQAKSIVKLESNTERILPKLESSSNIVLQALKEIQQSVAAHALDCSKKLGGKGSI